MKVKEESKKVALKLNIQKAKIMASSPSTSWQIDGETVERVTDFILGGSKITADGDCSHEIKRRLLLGEGNSTPLQYSCLENLVDRGAWWASVSGVAQSRTRLKQLCSTSSSNITADGECSHDIKRRLLLGRKGMTNLDSMLKSRDVTLPTKSG